MSDSIKCPKKLIEVALPLDAINVAAAKEKAIRQGHPSSLHLWWARRPLAAARAVIFAQMVNDPGYERSLGRGMNKEKAIAERERLFRILEQLVLWENTNNETLLAEAREEIWNSWRETCGLNKNHPDADRLFSPDRLPAFHDPFSGGGAIPLEAQRLGLESYATDLNPVAVTINKAMIEIPPRFAGRVAVGPIPKGARQGRLHDDWSGLNGLAEDVRRYGAWIRQEAFKRLSDAYPPIVVTPEMVTHRPDLKPLLGEKLTAIAWLWVRTVKSPNPAFSSVNVPLASSFVLSRKEGKSAYVEPVVQGSKISFVVKVGKPTEEAEKGTKANGRGANFLCALSGSPIDGKYIKAEGQAGRIGTRLMAVVAEGKRGRVYLSPPAEVEAAALKIQPLWVPDVEFFQQALGFRIGNYGLSKWADLFTNRQLLALSTFSDLLQEAIALCTEDACRAGMRNDSIGLESGGDGATAYAQAMGVYLAFALDKMADLGNSLVRWEPVAQCPRQLFGRQAIPMVWDFAEANPLSSSSGGWEVFVDGISKALAKTFLGVQSWFKGYAQQADASTQDVSSGKVVSTDPPFYDNIGYADLSDFFYVWLRRSLRRVFPGIYATVAVPKEEELVATPGRHGTKEGAEAFFLEGMTRAMHRLSECTHPAFPVTIFYAFKQSESSETGTVSTGWETFLEAVIRADFSVVGTWPMRTENSSRLRGQVSNALASSIVLVCRKRSPHALTVSRRDFLRELNATLPISLEEMTRGGVNSPVAPVDLSQSIIGPGMAIFSQYAAVLEADGSTMNVRSALTLINRFLAEDDFDHETQFCLHWFDGYGWSAGKYGDADVLARAKGTAVAAISEAGVVESGSGSVRLLRYAEYPDNWSPIKDNRTPIWEALHHMIRTLQSDGEAGAGKLLADMPSRAEPIRALAYRLYTLCERKNWAEEARAYNELITSWTGIEGASQEVGHIGTQVKLDI